MAGDRMGSGQMSRVLKHSRPPRLARRLLARIAPLRLRDTASGDYEELYHIVLTENGPWRAGAWYWGQVIKSIPAFLLNRAYWSLSMFKSYLKLAFRHMRRRPEFAAVNVAGLAIGLAGCIMAVLFIRDEFDYDRFHSHVERIFEVRSEIGAGSDVITLETRGPVGPTLAAQFPEVEAATRLAGAEVVVRNGDQALLRNGLGIDPSFSPSSASRWQAAIPHRLSATPIPPSWREKRPGRSSVRTIPSAGLSRLKSEGRLPITGWPA